MRDASYDIRMDEAVTLLPTETCTAFLACNSALDQRILAVPYDLIRTEREPGTCSAAFLPFLAWERSVHHWTADEATNRARVASSFADHRSYGCPPALEEEIQLDVGYADISVREWWEVKGFEWPDFQVVVHVEPGGPPVPAYVDVFASAKRRKNVRDWPGEVSYEARSRASLAIAAAPTLNATINLLPVSPKPLNIAGLFVGAAATLTATINLRPL